MLETLRRDVTTLLRGLTGAPPPFLVREGLRGPRLAREEVTKAAFALLVDEVSRSPECADGSPSDLTVWLRREDGAALPFVAGQFLSFDVVVDGQRHRRAYSLSSDPGAADRVRITVRRVAGGRVSNHLADTLAAGDKLMARGPSGRFVWNDDGANAPLILVAGGSGLTPIMAIAYAALARSSQPITLVYATRPHDPGLYADELAALDAAHPRLTVVRHHGDLTGEHLAGLNLPCGPDATAYLCGPDGLMAAADAYLRGAGVPADAVVTERFHSPGDGTQVRVHPPQPARFLRAGGDANVVVGRGETVLEAGLRAGVQLPFSCAMGGCGACRCRLVSGRMAMAEPHCLDAAEEAAGDILTCVARPLSPVVVEVR